MVTTSGQAAAQVANSAAQQQAGQQQAAQADPVTTCVVPIGTIGGLGLACLLAGALFWRARRASRSGHGWRRHGDANRDQNGARRPPAGTATPIAPRR